MSDYTVYSDYSRARIGWFFGLSGLQFAVLAAAVLPVFLCLRSGAWASAAMFAGIWVALVVITVVDVWGRSALGWLTAVLAYSLGGFLGWTSFRSKASRGAVADLEEADMPGRLQGIQIHDGPPNGGTQTRVAIIQDHATRSWAVTAAVTHPGVGMAENDERQRLGAGLSDLLDIAERGQMITEVILMVRTVPDDGAERHLWVTHHQVAGAPEQARRMNTEIESWLTQASVRTEQFITIVIAESKLAKQAKKSGGGIDGRARALHLLMSEIEAQLVGGMGMISVHWLSSPELALAVRTGFAPGDRAGVVQALAGRTEQLRTTGASEINTTVPWAHAGPTGAEATIRHYGHDAWNSISATLSLPDRGAVIGALAPVLMPGEPGERRSFMVCYPVVSQAKADRQAGNEEMAADLSEHLKNKAGMKERARARAAKARARGLDVKLARGNSLTLPYAVATVTVPKTMRVSDFGSRLDWSIRQAGFAPLRLDLAQDVCFAASTVPLGVSLTRKGDL